MAFVLLLGSLPAAAINTASGAQVFSDMPDNWATEALESAVANRLLEGYNGKIMPNSPLTRAQMAAIITRAFGVASKADLSGFSDVSSSDWFYDSIAAACHMGVMQGHGGKMDPGSPITREQAFTVLARALKLQPAESANMIFADADEISDWARGHIYAMINAGCIHGAGGRLKPKSSITRAEFAQVMHNIFARYIGEAGTYTEVADGNILVRVPGVTLKNVTIRGDLIIGDGVGEGDLKLENVTIKGRLVVRGGGVNSVVLTGGSVEGYIVISKVDGDIRVVIDGTDAETIVVEDGNIVIIEGDDGTVIVNVPGVHVIIRQGRVDRLEAACEGAAGITVEEGGQVRNLVVGSDAAGSTITVAGQVTNIETSAPRTSVAGTGSVGSVTVNKGADSTK